MGFVRNWTLQNESDKLDKNGQYEKMNKNEKQNNNRFIEAGNNARALKM